MKKLIALFAILFITIPVMAIQNSRFNSNLDPYSGSEKVGASKRWAQVNTNCVNVSSYTEPIIARDTWIDLATASTWTVYSVLVASGVPFLANQVYGTDVLTQMQTGRDVGVSGRFVTAGNDDKTIVQTFVVSGITCQGNTVNETVTISSASSYTAGMKYTNNAFIYISSITWRITSLPSELVTSTNLRLNIGFGTKIGLSNKIVTATDVIGAREGSVTSNPGSLAAGISTTYQTVTFVNAPNGSNEYILNYKIRKAP